MSNGFGVWRAWLAACSLLAACGRVWSIPAVEEPEEPPSDRDAEPDLDAALGAELDAEPLGQEHDAEAADGAADARAAQNTRLDAGRGRAVGDAGPTDAGGRRDGGDAGLSDGAIAPCSGARILDLCWYLGAVGQSCEQTCSGRGGYDARGAALVGTPRQGGTLGACAQVLGALGYRGQVDPGERSDNLGLGCHLWEDAGWWLASMPDFDVRSGVSPASIACACTR